MNNSIVNKKKQIIMKSNELSDLNLNLLCKKRKISLNNSVSSIPSYFSFNSSNNDILSRNDRSLINKIEKKTEKEKYIKENDVLKVFKHKKYNEIKIQKVFDNIKKYEINIKSKSKSKSKEKDKTKSQNTNKNNNYLKFITYLLENKHSNNNVNKKINISDLISNHYGLDEFSSFNDWENYENILILVIIILFKKYKNFNDFFDSYLQNNLNKLLTDKEFIGDCISLADKGINKNYLLRFYREINKFYIKRINSFIDKGLDIKIISDKNFCYYISFIYYQIKDEKELEFIDYDFNNESLEILLSSIKFSNHLLLLNLSTNHLGKEACYILGEILKANKVLNNLDISNCGINNESLEMLTQGLKKESFNNNMKNNNYYGLSKLNISCNNFNEESGEILGKVYMTLSNSLEWLNISKNKIMDEGTNNFLFFYLSLLDDKINYFNSNNNKLEVLILTEIGIFNENCLYNLSKIIKHPKCKLKSLTLNGNHIGENYISNSMKINYLKYFFKSLQQNKTVTELYLLNCSLSNDITEDLCEALAVNKNLEYLALYNNNLSNQSTIEKILGVISSYKERNNNKNNTTLKSLDLSKNNIHININEKFLNIINGLKLNTLDISMNEFGQENFEDFIHITEKINGRIKLLY